MSKLKTDPYEYTMSTVKAAFHSIAERIKDKTIFELEPIMQEKSKEIRYSKKIEFNNEVVKEYFNLNLDLNSKSFNNSLLKEPFYLDI